MVVAAQITAGIPGQAQAGEQTSTTTVSLENGVLVTSATTITDPCAPDATVSGFVARNADYRGGKGEATATVILKCANGMNYVVNLAAPK